MQPRRSLREEFCGEEGGATAGGRAVNRSDWVRLDVNPLTNLFLPNGLWVG